MTVSSANRLAFLVLLVAALTPQVSRAEGPEPEHVRRVTWEGTSGDLKLDYATDGSFQVYRFEAPSSHHLGGAFPDADALRKGDPRAHAFWSQEIAPVESSLLLLRGREPDAVALATDLLVKAADFEAAEKGPHGPTRFDLYVHWLHKEAAASIDEGYRRAILGVLEGLHRGEREHLRAVLWRAGRDWAALAEKVNPACCSLGRGGVVMHSPEKGTTHVFVLLDGEIDVEITREGAGSTLHFTSLERLKADRPELHAEWSAASSR